MYKRNGFVLGIVGSLAMLSFIIGVWNGINIKPRRRPNTLGFKKADDTPIRNIQYQLQNRNSRGLRISPNNEFGNDEKEKSSSEDNNYLKTEFIDIPKIVPNKKVKTIHKTTGRKFGKQKISTIPALPRTPYPAPLFSFKAMALPKSSLKYPFTYAKNLIKFRLALEFGNGTDLHQTTTKTKLPLQGVVDRIKSKPIYVNLGERSKDVFNIGETIHPNKARHILIATTWRSGSTFLGDLLNRYPGTFYSFEPLHYIDHKQGTLKDITSEMQLEFVKLVAQVFKCKPESGYFIHANKPENRFLFRHNFRLWNVCENLLMAGSACFMPELYLKTCPIFPIRVIKTVRLRVQETEKLLLDPQLGKTLKIVVLVRDPRGVMNSRSSMDWCKLRTCSDPLTVCKDLQSDVLAAFELKKKYPDHIHLIRYEDLSMDPFETVDNLLQFLDLSPNKLIENYIEEHTQTSRDATSSSTSTSNMDTTMKDGKAMQVRSLPYSTSRNSKATAFLWKKKMKNKDILKVQRVCKKPMRMLGYNPMTNIVGNKDDDDFPLIVKSSEELWSN